MVAKVAPLFESTACSRCGGSGRYSYNLMDGDRCYGCAGRGYVLTKRGRAAQNFLDELRSRPVEDLKVGDLVLVDLFFQKPKFMHIEAIKEDTLNTSPASPKWILEFPTENCAWGVTFGCGQKMRMGFTAVEKAAQVKLALEYQAGLTKAGVLSKRK